MKMSIRVLEQMTNATWLGSHRGVHKLRCKGCGEIHYARIVSVAGTIMPILVEDEIDDDIPPEEYVGEDIAIDPVWHEAIRAAFRED